MNLQAVQTILTIGRNKKHHAKMLIHSIQNILDTRVS